MNWLLPVALLSVIPAAAQPTPPAQPAAGPGGASYRYESFRRFGPFFTTSVVPQNNSYHYFIYQPAQPTPLSAPVVVFIHGLTGNTPSNFEDWLIHLTRKGFVVIWLGYDTSHLDPGYMNLFLGEYRDALGRLQGGGGLVRPAIDQFGRSLTAVVGHSAGAYLAFGMAIAAADGSSGVPEFRAIFAATPGQGAIEDFDFSRLDASIRYIIVAGDQDKPKRTCEATSIWRATSQIVDSNRDFIYVHSDDHGAPQQLGDHWFPLTRTNRDTADVDDRDFNITYKLSVSLLQCAFYGMKCEYALGHGSYNQIDMGLWSDGVPVTPLESIADPPAYFEGACAGSGLYR